MGKRISRTTVAVLVAASPALADDAQWLSPSGGTWSNPAFWSTGAAPAPDTDVSFNLKSANGYPVFIPASPPSTAGGLTVRTDKPTLYLNTRTLSLAGPLALAPAAADVAQLTLTFGGTLSSSATAASALAAPGGTATLNLAGSALALAGPLRVGAGGNATVNAGESSALTASAVELATTSDSTAALNLTYVLTATRQQTPPRLATAASVYVGGGAAGPGGVATFSTNGSVTIPGTLTVYDTGPAAPAGTRVHLTGGTLSAGALDTSGNPARFDWTAGTLNLTNSSLALSPTGPLGNALTLAPVVSGAFTLAKNLTVSGTLSLPDVTSSFSNAGSKVAASAVSNHGTFTQTAGTLTVTTAFDNYRSADFAGSQAWAPGSVFTNRPASPDAPTATFRSDAGSPTAYNLAVHADAGRVDFASPQHLAALTLGDAAAVTVLPHGSHTLSTRVLSITSTAARLDLTDNRLTIDYNGPSPADEIRQYLHDNQLISSSADAAHRLGYLFSGEPTAPTSLNVTLTIAGDANLDGKLDADDFALIDRGLATSGSYWWQGDFDYDGQVTSADYLLLDTAFGQAQGFSPGFLSQRKQQFGAPYVSALVAVVPEPASAAWLLAGATLLRRKRG